MIYSSKKLCILASVLCMILAGCSSRSAPSKEEGNQSAVAETNDGNKNTDPAKSNEEPDMKNPDAFSSDPAVFEAEKEQYVKTGIVRIQENWKEIFSQDLLDQYAGKQISIHEPFFVFNITNDLLSDVSFPVVVDGECVELL